MHYMKLATVGALLSGYINAAAALPHAPSVSVNSNKKVTRTSVADAACTYAPAQLIPTDIPTASPYISGTGLNYYPKGSQNQMILDGKTHAGWVSGPTQFPESNSFALAIKECSAFCDTSAAQGHGQCLSFNIFTVYESDFNNCIPTFECRFSSTVYNASDYSQDNGTPSYAWTLQIPTAPTCYIEPGQFGSPGAWTSAGMDSYLQTYAEALGIWDYQQNFLPKLMSYFGWTDYSCISDAPNVCSPNWQPNVSNCSNWLNQQVDFFEGYMANNVFIYQKIHDHVSTWGESVFEMFWQGVPSGVADKGFDPSSLIEAIISTGISMIPEVGSVFSTINTLAVAAASGIGGPTVIPTVQPDEHSTWVSINTAMDAHISYMTENINEYSRSVVQSNAILEQVTKGGAFFLPNDSALQPDPDKVWDLVEPYWASQIAMGAMKAQEVFLLTVPVSMQPQGGACTQGIADTIASYVSQGSQGEAWCTSDTEVAVPIVGPIYNGVNVGTYTPFKSINGTAPIGSSKATLFASTSSCYKDFSPSNGNIKLYQSTNLTAKTDGTYDLTTPCAWSLPICDQAAWQPTFDAQCKNSWDCGSITPFAPSKSDQVVNMAQWCAYQMGFMKSVWLCQERTPTYRNPATRECGTWGVQAAPPPKVFKLQ